MTTPSGHPGFSAETGRDARMWAALCHAAAFAGFVMPFGNVAGPLVLWLLKRNDHDFIDDQGKEAVNFQLGLTIYLLISLVLMLVLVGFLLFAAGIVFGVVFAVIAAVRANEGRRYRYPLTIRFIS
jgi:uncharacterized Tic20 family protein